MFVRPPASVESAAALAAFQIKPAAVLKWAGRAAARHDSETPLFLANGCASPEAALSPIRFSEEG